MYSLKTSPRLVGDMTSHSPSFLQGLVAQGPGGRRGFTHQLNLRSWRRVRSVPTCLGQVAGITSKAICTNTDEGIVSDSGHTRPSIVAVLYITVVAWEWAGIRIMKVEQNGNRNLRLCWSLSLASHPSDTSSRLLLFDFVLLFDLTLMLICFGQLGFSDAHRLDQTPDDPWVLVLGWSGLSRQQRCSLSAKVLSADSQIQARSGTECQSSTMGVAAHSCMSHRRTFESTNPNSKTMATSYFILEAKAYLALWYWYFKHSTIIFFKKVGILVSMSNENSMSMCRIKILPD